MVMQMTRRVVRVLPPATGVVTSRLLLGQRMMRTGLMTQQRMRRCVWGVEVTGLRRSFDTPVVFCFGCWLAGWLAG
jgi:hypothetical protein